MKLHLTAPKPRNPLVAAARTRVAGTHQRSTRALRFQAQRALQREIAGLHDADRRRASP